MTNNKQQTAVDSIIELCQELLANHYSISHDAVCSEVIKFCQEQAKEMDKEQKIRDFTDGYLYRGEQLRPWLIDKWYEETYGGGKQ
jgi:hypothetical protein